MLVVIFLSSNILFAILGFWGATQWPLTLMQTGMARQSVFKTSSTTLSIQVTRLEEQLFNKTQELVLARRTMELLKLNNIALQKRYDKVSQELGLFRRIVKEQQQTKGLSFGRLTLAQTDDEAFELALDVIQISGAARVRGNLSMSIEGFDASERGEWVSIPLHLGNTSDERSMRLDFTNFQTVEVAVRLPKHFEPRQILVDAKFTKGKNVTLTKRFDWDIGD